MWKRGLVIGKFYPPHRGHKYLIDTAKNECEHVTVIIGWKQSESIPGMLRAKWLQEIHPNVEVIAIEDNKLDDNDSEGWAKYTIELLGYVPDVVFTSEKYGDPYAKFMGAVHVLVDLERKTVPISATLVRSDPQKYAPFLEPCVRAYFARRIAIVGAESTGTTTLAKDLANHYHTVWVPEYGRVYSEGKLFADENAKWRSEEFVTIAKAQSDLEDKLAENSNGIVIADTDPFATTIWHERYMRTRSSEVETIAHKRDYDLYILTGDEIPFVQDGTRDSEHLRQAMNARFAERLLEEKKRVLFVQGSKEQRLKQAVEAIDSLAVNIP